MPRITKDELIKKLSNALREASIHLDWIGYGDGYESSCAYDVGLNVRIEDALESADNFPDA